MPGNLAPITESAKPFACHRDEAGMPEPKKRAPGLAPGRSVFCALFALFVSIQRPCGDGAYRCRSWLCGLLRYPLCFCFYSRLCEAKQRRVVPAVAKSRSSWRALLIFPAKRLFLPCWPGVFSAPFAARACTIDWTKARAGHRLPRENNTSSRSSGCR